MAFVIERFVASFMGEPSRSIEDLCAHLDLGPQDGLGLDLNEITEDESCQSPQWCIVGRFVTKRNINFKAIQELMLSVWSPVMKVWMKELESNLFLIQFSHEMDYAKVIKGGPWSFDQQLFVFTTLDQDTNPHEVVLNYVDFWVQVHNLSAGLLSEQVALAIGNFIGQYVSSDPKNFDGLWKSYLRIRVRVDVSKSLKSNMKIKKRNQEEYWVNFKYERLPNFCFFCGIIGHAEKSCVKLYQYPDKNAPRLFGTWLRAPVGRNQAKPNSQWNISRSYGGWSESSHRSVSDPVVSGNVDGKGSAGNSHKATNFQNAPLRKEGTNAGTYSNNHANFSDMQHEYLSRNNPLFNGVENPSGGASQPTTGVQFNSNINGGINSNFGMVTHGQQVKDMENFNAMGLDNGPGTIAVVENKKRRLENGIQLNMGPNGDVVDGANLVSGQSSKNSVEAGLGVGARRAL